MRRLKQQTVPTEEERLEWQAETEREFNRKHGITDDNTPPPFPSESEMKVILAEQEYQERKHRRFYKTYRDPDD
jgi:hypothetical protein